MGTLNVESICFRCQRREVHYLEGFGTLTGCASAGGLEDHGRVFKCDLTVTACERFEEKEEKKDDPRLEN